MTVYVCSIPQTHLRSYNLDLLKYKGIFRTIISFPASICGARLGSSQCYCQSSVSKLQGTIHTSYSAQVPLFFNTFTGKISYVD